MSRSRSGYGFEVRTPRRKHWLPLGVIFVLLLTFNILWWIITHVILLLMLAAAVGAAAGYGFRRITRL